MPYCLHRHNHKVRLLIQHLTFDSCKRVSLTSEMTRGTFRLRLLPLLLLVAYFTTFPTIDASTSFQSTVPPYEAPGLHPFPTQNELLHEAIRDPFGFPTSSYVASTHDLKNDLNGGGLKRSTFRIPYLQTSRNAEIQSGKIRTG